MQPAISTMLKFFIVTVFAITTFVAGPSAKADEVTFQGYTNGCFNCASPPTSSAQQTATVLNLTYNNSTFNNTTVSGMLGLGGNPIAPGSQNIDNFGSFTLALPSSGTDNYNGNTFSLRVTFSLPAGITGGQSQLYTATVIGAVSTTGNGGVNINFDNSPIVFTFSNPTASGSFTLEIHDVSVNPGQTASIDAFITSATQTSVPEPATLLLFGTGMVGLGAGLRRRYRR